MSHFKDIIKGSLNWRLNHRPVESRQLHFHITTPHHRGIKTSNSYCCGGFFYGLISIKKPSEALLVRAVIRSWREAADPAAGGPEASLLLQLSTTAAS